MRRSSWVVGAVFNVRQILAANPRTARMMQYNLSHVESQARAGAEAGAGAQAPANRPSQSRNLLAVPGYCSRSTPPPALATFNAVYEQVLIQVSSMRMRRVARNMQPLSLLGVLSHDWPMAVSRGGLHLEWNVAPPSMSNAAMPEAAIARALAPWNQTWFRST
ncbi:hypothetical protein VYU27_009174 [Nannochloropsis oceanica]